MYERVCVGGMAGAVATLNVCLCEVASWCVCVCVCVYYRHMFVYSMCMSM